MQNQNEVKSKTEKEYIDAMQRLYIEISSIEEGLKELKDEAKAKGFNAGLIAAVAKARANAKTEDLLIKSEQTIRLIEKSRE